MTEFWVCEACKSLVRGNAPACYKCRAPRPVEARELNVGARGAQVTPGIDQGMRQVGFALAADRPPLPTRALAVLTVIGVMVVVATTIVGAGLLAYYGWALLNARTDLILDRSLAQLAGTINLVQGAAFWISLALWLIFEAFSLWNAPLLGAGSAPRSIPAALLWWFVPVLNIVIPIRVVIDLHARLASKGSSGQLVVGAWWACYVAAEFLMPVILVVTSLSAFSLSLVGGMGVPTVAGLTMGLVGLHLVAELLYVIAGFAFIGVVLDLDARQGARRRWLDEGREAFAAAVGA